MEGPIGAGVRPIIFVCDIQEKFRNPIHEFPSILATTQKVLKASQILNIPVVATTQLRAKLGETCSELNLDREDDNDASSIKTLAHVDKTLFSMWTPEVRSALESLSPSSSTGEAHAVAILGIETHICVTQTTLDLLRAGHSVYVLADGVSSCNPGERNVALARLRQAGAVVTTSESWLYEVTRDAARTEFKQVAGLVKEWSGRTKEAVEKLCVT